MSQRNDENISETIAQCQLLHTKIAKNMKKKILLPRASTACACHNKSNLRTKKIVQAKLRTRKIPTTRFSPPRRTLAPQALRALAPTNPILEQKNSFKQNLERALPPQQDSPPPRRTLALQALRALAPTNPILERKNPASALYRFKFTTSDVCSPMYLDKSTVLRKSPEFRLMFIDFLLITTRPRTGSRSMPFPTVLK